MTRVFRVAFLLLGMGGTAFAAEVLIVERRGEELAYKFKGHDLDSKKILTGMEARTQLSSTTELFVLLGEGVPVEQAFELGSLLTGKAGLRNVRYFAFSRQTGVMQEFKLDWTRWKLSESGKLEPALR